MGRMDKKIQKTLGALLLTMTMHSIIVGQSAKAPVWFKKLSSIEFFKTTQLEAEILFDRPTILADTRNDSREKGWGYSIRYRTHDGELEFSYSRGGCLPEYGKQGINIPDNLVVGYSFKPSFPSKLDDFGITLADFTIEKEMDTQNRLYRNGKLGVSFVVSKRRISYLDVLPDTTGARFLCSAN